MQKTDSISEGMCRAGACTHAVLSFLLFPGLGPPRKTGFMDVTVHRDGTNART